jgi:hypothetical protein
MTCCLVENFYAIFGGPGTLGTLYKKVNLLGLFKRPNGETSPQDTGTFTDGLVVRFTCKCFQTSLSERVTQLREK